jgi:hypothetical protein
MHDDIAIVFVYTPGHLDGDPEGRGVRPASFDDRRSVPDAGDRDRPAAAGTDEVDGGLHLRELAVELSLGGGSGRGIERSHVQSVVRVTKRRSRSNGVELVNCRSTIRQVGILRPSAGVSITETSPHPGDSTMFHRLTYAVRRVPLAWLLIVLGVAVVACSNGSGGAGY